VLPADLIPPDLNAFDELNAEIGGLNFAHGTSLLKTLDLDVHQYSLHTLVDLVIEIFYKVRHW
jgi:hypothetical protein